MGLGPVIRCFKAFKERRQLIIISMYLCGTVSSLGVHSKDAVSAACILAFACLIIFWLISGWQKILFLLLAFLFLGMMIGSLRLESMRESILDDLRNRRVTAQLEVIDTPNEHSRKITAIATVTSLDFPGASYSADEKALVELNCNDRCEKNSIKEGDRLVVDGYVGDLPESSGGGFEYGAYLRRMGVNAVISGNLNEIEIIPGGRGGLSGYIDDLRAHSRESLKAGGWDSSAGLFQGMVLGDTAQIPEDVISDFRDSGLLHLLAVSGQNVLLLSFIIMAIGRTLALPKAVSIVLSAAVIAIYVPLTGADPSIVRAGVVGILGLAAGLLSRQPDRFHFLALAAAVILSLNPYDLLDPGFQLSFGAVLAIFFVSPAISAPLVFLPSVIREPVAISAAACLVTAPILLVHFQQIPLVTIPANVAAAPVAGPVMFFGVCTVIASFVFPPLSWPINAAAALCTGYLTTTAHFFASFPQAVYFGEAPGYAVIIVYYCMVALMILAFKRISIAKITALRKRGRWRKYLVLIAAMLIMAAGFACFDNKTEPPAEFTASFLDVGQGDAILLQVPGGATILVDGGPDSGIIKNLEKSGVEKLDAVFLSHPHADHLTGLISVLNKYEVDGFYDAASPSSSPDYRDLLRLVEKKKIPYTVVRRGNERVFGDLTIRVLHPDGNQSEDDMNANSVVISANYKGLDILLTGDAESAVLGNFELGEAEVYKIGHHGSGDEGIDSVLAILKPSVAVISAGKDNPYGHPSGQTLNALEGAGVSIYRTDRDGTIRISLREGEIEVKKAFDGK